MYRNCHIVAVDLHANLSKGTMKVKPSMTVSQYSPEQKSYFIYILTDYKFHSPFV